MFGCFRLLFLEEFEFAEVELGIVCARFRVLVPFEEDGVDGSVAFVACGEGSDGRFRR